MVVVLFGAIPAGMRCYLTAGCGVEYTCRTCASPVGIWPSSILTCTNTTADRKGYPMPVAHLPGNLQMYYEDDDFTDPWSTAETVILHHGNAKNSRLWYAWVPLLAGEFRGVWGGGRGFCRSSFPP